LIVEDVKLGEIMILKLYFSRLTIKHEGSSTNRTSRMLPDITAQDVITLRSKMRILKRGEIIGRLSIFWWLRVVRLHDQIPDQGWYDGDGTRLLEDIRSPPCRINDIRLSIRMRWTWQLTKPAKTVPYSVIVMHGWYLEFVNELAIDGRLGETFFW